jgi:MFS family permease
VSLLMDISSEMIHALRPVCLAVGLGTTALTVGVIEGIAEATAWITKVFSGALSDRVGRRKELAAIGYGLAALTKPIFPLAPPVGWLVAARFIDRVGKAIRGAPRDALVADSAPPELRGAAFVMFNLATGITLLAASVRAGALWDSFGPQRTFLARACCACVAVTGLIPLHRRLIVINRDARQAD